MAKRNSSLFAEPSEAQKQRARDVVDALKREGWSYTFHPFNVLGERAALKDPGNRGRLSQATRAAFNRSQHHIEILAERGFATKHFGPGSDHATLLSRALQLFPGSRLYF